MSLKGKVKKVKGKGVPEVQGTACGRKRRNSPMLFHLEVYDTSFFICISGGNYMGPVSLETLLNW